VPDLVIPVPTMLTSTQSGVVPATQCRAVSSQSLRIIVPVHDPFAGVNTPGVPMVSLPTGVPLMIGSAVVFTSVPPWSDRLPHESTDSAQPAMNTPPSPRADRFANALNVLAFIARLLVPPVPVGSRPARRIREA
jgi:hypothetical protein